MTLVGVDAVCEVRTEDDCAIVRAARHQAIEADPADRSFVS
jgi:hypothetical protein